MCEHNRRFVADLEYGSILKIPDGVRTLKWPSEFWMVHKKDVVQRLLACDICEIANQVSGAPRFHLRDLLTDKGVMSAVPQRPPCIHHVLEIRADKFSNLHSYHFIFLPRSRPQSRTYNKLLVPILSPSKDFRDRHLALKLLAYRHLILSLDNN